MFEKAVKHVCPSENLNPGTPVKNVIREANPEDLEDIDELARESWIEGFSNVLSDEELEMAEDMEFISRESLEENLDAEGVVTLVYEQEGKVVARGRIGFTEDEVHSFVDVGEKEVQLRAFYVHPDYWNQGIGTRLLEELVDRIPERFEKLKVETFEGADAVEFYRRKGFRVVEKGIFSAEDTPLVKKDYPTVVMEKDLE